MSTVFRHIRSGRLYDLIGTARDVTDPTQVSVVYRQLYASTLETPDTTPDSIPLPIGSIWIRNEQDFYNKFERIQ